MNRKNQAGASMLEVLMYLSLVIVMSVSMMQVYTTEVRKADRLRLENQIYDIVDKVQVLEFGHKDAITFDEAYKKKLETAGANLHHKWGIPSMYDITISSSDGNACIAVKVDNLPNDACIHLASQITSRCTKAPYEMKVNDVAGGFENCAAHDHNAVVIYADKN
ncbi:MAG: type II secretion system GspH family protein [Rickettsiales bacterium]|jgi:Tfp pilus assembly protein PilV|nr:type II secretion system GspH family protein [Rickettsiales bacterium]